MNDPQHGSAGPTKRQKSGLVEAFSGAPGDGKGGHVPNYWPATIWADPGVNRDGGTWSGSTRGVVAASYVRADLADALKGALAELLEKTMALLVAERDLGCARARQERRAIVTAKTAYQVAYEEVTAAEAAASAALAEYSEARRP